MKFSAAFALLLAMAPAAQASAVKVDNTTPARAIAIAKDSVSVDPKIYTMADCKKTLEDNAKEMEAEVTAILCVPADMSKEGFVTGDELPIIDLAE